MSSGRYWIRLSRFLTMAASWLMSRAARLPKDAQLLAAADGGLLTPSRRGEPAEADLRQHAIPERLSLLIPSK